MFIPQTSTSAVANNLPRLNSDGKLPISMMTTGASALALLDASSILVAPVQNVKTSAPSTTAGEVGLDSGKLKFGDGANVQQAEVVSQKDQNNGYAGLDANQLLNKPAKKVRTGASSGTTSGSIAVNNGDLTFGEGANERTVENTSRKGQNNGYAGLDNNGKVAQEPASKGANNGIAALDGGGLLAQAAKLVQVGAASTTNGSIGVDGTDHDLKFGEGANVRVVENTSRKGQANGYAGLDGSGKVPAGQLPAAVVGAMSYVGGWNAGTNSPDISAAPAKGQFWIVTGAGVVGGIDYQVGDWAVFDGASFDKIDNTDQVASVFGRTGTVTAHNGDYSVDQVTNAASTSYVDGAVSAEADARDAAIATALGTAEGLISDEADARATAVSGAITTAEGYTDAAVADILDGSTFTGPIQTAGRKRKLNVKSVGYTITASDEVILGVGGVGGIAFLLPPATGSGAEYRISKEDGAAGYVTVNTDQSGTADTINGASSYVLMVQYETATFLDAGPDMWRVF